MAPGQGSTLRAGAGADRRARRRLLGRVAGPWHIVRVRRRELIFGAAAVGGLLAAPGLARAGATKRVRVGLYQAKGVHPVAFAAEKALLEQSAGFVCTVLRPADIRGGALAEQDVIVFMGGSGTSQGRALGDEGKLAVKRFVAGGGGYIGVCAGAYLAMQGEEEFHKLRLVASRNLTGDFWQRGIAGLEVKAEGRENFKLFFANGPIFTPAPTEGLAPYISLATYVGEIYNQAKGTGAGEMPGTPAIVAAAHGEGRVLLFSPNPVLGGEGVVHSELMLAGLRWAATRGQVPDTLRFADVFG